MSIMLFSRNRSLPRKTSTTSYSTRRFETHIFIAVKVRCQCTNGSVTVLVTDVCRKHFAVYRAPFPLSYKCKCVATVAYMETCSAY